LASTGDSPTAIAAGNEMSVPPPAIELIAPATHDAAPKVSHRTVSALCMQRD